MDNSIVYKYRDWDNNFHKAILLKNELYIPTVNELNDPFDFTISFDYKLLNTSEKQEEYINLIIESSRSGLESRGININLKIRELREMFAIEEKRKLCIEEHFIYYNKESSKHFGVCSFANKWDNNLMWSHYSNNHSGFCLGFKKEKFEDGSFFGSWGNVDYLDQFPLTDPRSFFSADTLILQSHSKNKKWEYEDEYRLTKLWEDHVPELNEKNIFFHDDFIAELIIGFKMKEEDKRQLVSIAKEKNILVYLTKMNLIDRKLEREILY